MTSILARLRRAPWLATGLALAALSGCGGDSGGAPAATEAVGVLVSGLASGTTLVLQDGTDDLTVTSNNTFSFATRLTNGATYDVTVKTQPVGQTCSVTSGNGTIGISQPGGPDIIPGVQPEVTCTATGLASSTTSSTAFAVLATPDARIAFVPGSLGVVPFSLEGTAVGSGASNGASAQSARRAASTTSTLVGLSFSPDSCTVDSGKLMVTCISYQSTKLAFLDVSTFATSLKAADIRAVEYDSGAPDSQTGFSGGSCVLCGIVALTGQNRVVVSAFDGYRVYAYPGAGALSPLTPAKSYAVPITENFAVDPVHLFIAAAEYYPSGTGTRALRLINLANDKIYKWDTPTDACATADAAACTSDFKTEETDSETFDVQTGLLVMQSENGNAELMLDLSQAVFDDVALTFSAPHQYADVTNPYDVEMAGALASPNHSFLFMVPEFAGAYAGVEALPAQGSNGVFASYTADPVFVDLNVQSAASPCGGNLLSGGDPHSEGFTTSLAARDVGLFITGDRACIVKVDLQGLDAAPRNPAAGHPHEVDPAYDLVANGVVTYVKVQ